MANYVAFLRGMNLGRRRITNDELCDCFRDLGFGEVSAFLASGNVIFDGGRKTPGKIAEHVEKGLKSALNYDVPTFLRSLDDVMRIAEHTPFSERVGADGGKLQVAMLGRKPTAAQRKAALAHTTDDDQLAIHGQELYWLPVGKLTESELDFKAIEKALGTMTVRTRKTLERIAARFGAT